MMTTSFSFGPILRGLALPRSAVVPTRAEVGRTDGDGEGSLPVYRATLYDAAGASRVHCSGVSPESAVRGALLGLLAANARIQNIDVREAQAFAVRLTTN